MKIRVLNNIYTFSNNYKKSYYYMMQGDELINSMKWSVYDFLSILLHDARG